MEATNGLHSATKEDILTALRTEAFTYARSMLFAAAARKNGRTEIADLFEATARTCLLYTSPSPRDGLLSRMPSSA